MKRTANPTQVKRSPLKVVTTILAIIVVALFASAFHQINDCAQGYSIEYNARDYVYSAEAGRFGNLYDTAIHDMDRDGSYSPEVAECRALAFYYEQAVLEHAFRESGDTEKADGCARRMEDYAAQLGSFSKRAEAVREAVAK